MWTRSELKRRAKESLKANYGSMVGVVGLVGLMMVGSLLVVLYLRGDCYADLASGSFGFDIQFTPQTVAFISAFLVVRALLLGPLTVAVRRCSLQALRQPAAKASVLGGLTDNYLEVVKAICLRDLLVFVGCMLFLVPGIVFSLQYAMVPYLLADNPRLTRAQAFEQSRRLMRGQLGSVLALRLSFAGWNVLSALTLFALQVLFVMPYRELTMAGLYERLRVEQDRPSRSYQTPPAPPQGYGRPAMN